MVVCLNGLLCADEEGDFEEFLPYNIMELFFWIGFTPVLARFTMFVVCAGL